MAILIKTWEAKALKRKSRFPSQRQKHLPGEHFSHYKSTAGSLKEQINPKISGSSQAAGNPRFLHNLAESPVQIYRVWLIEITVDNLMSPGDFLDSHACPPRRSGTGQKVKESRRKVLRCWALYHQCFVYSIMKILVEDKMQETLFFKHYWINFISFSELNGSLYKYLPNSDVNFGLENSLWRARG